MRACVSSILLLRPDVCWHSPTSVTFFWCNPGGSSGSYCQGVCWTCVDRWCLLSVRFFILFQTDRTPSAIVGVFTTRLARLSSRSSCSSSLSGFSRRFTSYVFPLVGWFSRHQPPSRRSPELHRKVPHDRRRTQIPIGSSAPLRHQHLLTLTRVQEALERGQAEGTRKKNRETERFFLSAKKRELKQVAHYSRAKIGAIPWDLIMLPFLKKCQSRLAVLLSRPWKTLFAPRVGLKVGVWRQQQQQQLLLLLLVLHKRTLMRWGFTFGSHCMNRIKRRVCAESRCCNRLGDRAR